MSLASPESVTTGLREGSSEAAGEVRRRVRTILRFRGYGIPAEDRLDLEQTIVMQTWQAVEQDSFEPARLWQFVNVVTSRRCIDWLRTRAPRAEELSESLPAQGVDPARNAVEEERLALARAALATLSESCQQLIELRIAQEKSYKEISGILGKSEGALRVQMTRCIQRASEALERLRAEKDRPDV
jgi:RNA polymerase sigma-70 factor (ECF subfamily)